MKNTITLLILVGLAVILVFSGFQCGSAEMTSAKLYIQRSEWESAKDQLQKELAKNPQNSEAWYLLGRVNYEMKNFEEMSNSFNSSLKINNQFKNEIDNLKLSVWANSLNKGVDFYNQAIQAEKEDAAEYFNKAIENLKTSILVVPDSVASYRILALCYYASKDKDNAIPYMKEFLKRQSDAQIYRMLGGIYYDRAMTVKEKAKNLEGQEKEKALEKMNADLNEAIKVLEDALKVTPDDVNVLAMLNDSYITAGKTEEAIQSYKISLKSDPNNKYVYYNLGVLLLRANRHEEAIENFTSALKLDNNFSDALYNNGVAYMQWGQKMREKAEADVQGDKSKQIDKSYEEKFKSAKNYLEKLVAISPEDISGWESLGMVNTILNLPKEAKKAFDKADELRKLK